MKSIHQWRYNENYNYTPSIDGQPLNPHTIAATEQQIRYLARHIKSSFQLDDKWKKYEQQISLTTQLLDQAADTIGDVMSAEERNTPHKFHNTNQ